MFKLSSVDIALLTIFPSQRWSGGYVKICRYIETDYGAVKQDLFLHRVIVRPPGGFEVDHINRDKLDNRRENLRLATRMENMQNKAKASGCTSKYRGVSWRGRVNKKNPWGAYISNRGKRVELGYFPTEKIAALAYDQKARVIWGDFAFQNFPESTK